MHSSCAHLEKALSRCGGDAAPTAWTVKLWAVSLEEVCRNEGRVPRLPCGLGHTKQGSSSRGGAEDTAVAGDTVPQCEPQASKWKLYEAGGEGGSANPAWDLEKLISCFFFVVVV